MRRWIFSLVGLLVVYGNLAVILHPSRIGLGSLPALPRPKPLHDAFLMTGMFSTYSQANIELFVEGKRHDPTTGEAYWASISVADHLPQRRGVAYSTLFAAHHRDFGGAQAQYRAWTDIAQRIRGRHNRLHPLDHVTHVRFGVQTWPKHPEGYQAGRELVRADRQVWFSESRDPKGDR